VVRLFNVYYPVRLVVLFGGELLLISVSFLMAVLIGFGPDTFLVLNYEFGYYKIIGVTVLALLCLYYFDLYDLQRLRSRGETYSRLLIVVGALSLLLAGIGYLLPDFMIGNSVFLVGLLILTAMLFSWRALYGWMIGKPFLRERVYVLGDGNRAARLVEALRSRVELGMDVVGWSGEIQNDAPTRESLGQRLIALREQGAVDRVIVALSNRRGTMPVSELLDLRLHRVRVEEATDLLEKIFGKIEVDELHPSWLVFAEGFRLSPLYLVVRRVISLVSSLFLLLAVLPLLPLIALAIKLTSPGPVLYRQRRVGRNGVVFNCYKFRTMRQDAEADTGPTWAGDEDPRITTVGNWLRRLRLDELPQLWNVFRGDMAFVGPRPERPEFVEWLIREIPYYNLRHVVRPGITGWAQVSYQYGASLEEAREKLKYDLYYIKNVSVSLDLYIIFLTIKIVLFGRGAK
jgi:sugar transferase (PEP-CTERM system associated)